MSCDFQLSSRDIPLNSLQNKMFQGHRPLGVQEKHGSHVELLAFCSFGFEISPESHEHPPVSRSPADVGELFCFWHVFLPALPFSNLWSESLFRLTCAWRCLFGRYVCHDISNLSSRDILRTRVRCSARVRDVRKIRSVCSAAHRRPREGISTQAEMCTAAPSYPVVKETHPCEFARFPSC